MSLLWDSDKKELVEVGEIQCNWMYGVTGRDYQAKGNAKTPDGSYYHPKEVRCANLVLENNPHSGLCPMHTDIKRLEVLIESHRKDLQSQIVGTRIQMREEAEYFDRNINYANSRITSGPNLGYGRPQRR